MNEIKVSIFRRAGTKTYLMQYRDPETGNKTRKSSEQTDKRKAERAAANWEKEIKENGYHGRDGRILWADFRERYENEVLPSLAPATERKVWGVFNVFEKLMKVNRLGNITTDTLSRYQKALREQGRAEATIKGHLAHLQAALSWAASVNLIREAPAMPSIQRAKTLKMMKGRPITTEEFERMLAKVPDVVGEPAAESWRHLLRGLWWSGLRLGEALDLHWTDTTKLSVDLSLRHPMLRIVAELEKGNQDRLLPMAPEFAAFLAQVPESRRHGFVFNPKGKIARGERITTEHVGKVVTRIGEAAGVVVTPQKGTAATEKQPASADFKPAKFASAHDLRRSFGERWASRVMPQVLRELMRHESIETTMKYYVGRNAQSTAAILWQAAGDTMPALGAVLGADSENTTLEGAVNP